MDKLGFEDASFGSNNANTAAMHNEIRGCVKLVAAELNIPAVPVNPASLKSWACGNGRAKKPQMIAALKTLLGIETTDHNEADAIWIAEYVRQGIVVAKTKPRRSKRPKKAERLF